VSYPCADLEPCNRVVDEDVVVVVLLGGVAVVVNVVGDPNQCFDPREKADDDLVVVVGRCW